jgi:two-component system CheB/CheR fusion protein
MPKVADTAFPIVGIGASAGGVEALEGFFKDMPPQPGCGFVIVTHLSPERRSLLPEIVARYTDMPVHVAEDGAEVRPNEVHVLPADAVLNIEGRTLKISKPALGRRERKPIDIFLGELAKAQGEYAAGVILSGGDGDGTLGVKAIKERGGLTLAQIADGTAPQYPDMPDSAIASGMIDLAVSVSEMGARLAEFARSFELLDELTAKAEKAAGEPDFAEARREIYVILRNQVGHDFSGYKARTFLRRVQRRMQVNRIEALEAYVERLRQDPQEIGALFRDLLINVTNFFRDAEAFEQLSKLVIPKLFDGRGADETVRIWVPGCATGEEVFSIAMLMREHMDTLVAVPRVQIFATDIDEAALSVARAARYPDALLDSVSAERRKRFFVLDGGSYVISKDVRDLCVFSPHSVIRDPPFSRLDMVSCRNLLIYFGPDVQNQVIPIFHYALRPGGYLFLGTSENVTQFGDLFASLDKKHRIFRSHPNVTASVRLPLTVSGLRPAPFTIGHDRPPKGVLTGMALRNVVEQQVLERFAPAHVVVNRDGDIVHFSARTGKYLEPSTGAPSRQLLTMARKGLRLDLRTLLREAVETERRVVRERLALDVDDGRVQLVTATIEPLNAERGEDRLFLILFEDMGPSLSPNELAAGSNSTPETAAHLERELRDTRERLQSLIEEYETALEELKSSNEELVSVNEELQSTNEEMEASKEELQSVNEELHTVNAELIGKVEALDRANSDLHNLFESTQVGTVFLDRNLVIRSFTPALTRIFNILPSDRGRPLTDLSSRLSLPTLAADVRSVFATGEVIERAMELDGGEAHYLGRVAPYRGADQRVAGVVATFVDVTSLTRAEAHHHVLIAELNHRVKNMLTVVVGIVEQLAKSPNDTAAFKAAVISRLHAMARTYALVSRESWTQTSIDELAQLEFAPFGPGRSTLEGPDVRLNPRQTLSLGMVLHELATNAGKYGALSAPAGRVSLVWKEQLFDGEPGLSLAWREHGGPPAKPSKPSFGHKLVDRETSGGLGGKASIAFTEQGLAVDIDFPLERLAPTSG